MVVGTVELYMRQMCVLLSSQFVEPFRPSSKHSSHIEGMCLLAKWMVGQEYLVVTRLYIDS